LKEEARILGLSAPCQPSFKPYVVGAVFRGNLWLDAILTCTLKGPRSRYLSNLAEAIRTLKQYSQIRAAIFSRENVLPLRFEDFRTLAKMVDFPVFAICKKPHPGLVKRHEIVFMTMNKILVPVWVGGACKEHERVKEVLSLGRRNKSHLPEAVRAAELIANGLPKSGAVPRAESSNP
jgi:endonuclease V-like protein UPF0215 family